MFVQSIQVSGLPLNAEEIAGLLVKIRLFEESLDELFKKGVIHGTYHRCIGQEATAVGICRHLDQRDFIVSNHRNHGHYLAFTNDFKGLLEELKGSADGISKGLGGSQVIFTKNFISNGILGSTVPIAVGLSFGFKLKKARNCVVCFMGDGALCEGVVYEAINMASLWSLPILFVVENNFIAQTVPIHEILAGSLPSRFEAVGVPCTVLSSTDVFEISEQAGSIIEKVRNEVRPYALIVEADRLCPHSKGDDTRSKQYVEEAKKKDPLEILKRRFNDYETIFLKARTELSRILPKENALS